MSVDLMNHVFQSLEKHFPSPIPPSAATADKSSSHGQKDAHADPGTAGVGSLYPMTCHARYYNAASMILEDELPLFNHANANELGEVIEQWIAKKRENWEPR